MVTALDQLAARLRERLRDNQLHRAGDQPYAAATTLGNAAVTTQPALVVRPQTSTEVAAAVSAAQQVGLSLSVRGGGHDWAGSALREGGHKAYVGRVSAGLERALPMSEPQLRVSEALAERFRATPFSYPEVGATRQDQLPRGYRHLELQIDAGRGRKRYDDLAERLLSWQLHTDSGLSLQVSDERVRQGAVLVATLPLGGPFKINTRCRVVYVISEDRRTGFAYGTLPGHPERGEERFHVELLDDERVIFSVRAFSRNAWLLARLGSPISNRVQAMVNRRYLAAAAS